MKRSLPTASAAAILTALTVVSGCSSAPSASTTATASAAPTTVQATAGPTPASTPGTPVAGIPALGATATDLKTAPTIPAGTGQPPTQLLTQNIVVGTGPKATPNDTVNVRYVGALYDGTPFDSSWSRGNAPISFPLNQVVPGFAQGIEGMAPGGRRVIVIPPALGYGDEAQGPIPGGSTLVFVVDLVGIS
ncbi:MAG: peptidylprolyl isomerase [Pseudonocardiales bacterium]|nr:peptidylprolyl isomerase [Pseudonocardiales bacterium]